MRIIGIILLSILALAVVIGIGIVWAGVALGAGCAWILERPFSDGWNAVWDRWVIALGWSFLFLGSAIGGSSSRRR